MLNARKATGGGTKIKALDPGTYPARLYGIVDLGLQPPFPGDKYGKGPQHKFCLMYQFLDEFLEDEDGEEDLEKPRVQSEDMPLFNLSADKATSTKRYYVLDPEEVYEGDWSKLLETPVMITMVPAKNKKPDDPYYTRIGAIGPMRPKQAEKAEELTLDTILFDLDEPDLDEWKKVPNFIKKKIEQNLEFKGSRLEAMLVDAGEETQEQDSPRQSKKDLPDDVEDDELPY